MSAHRTEIVSFFFRMINQGFQANKDFMYARHTAHETDLNKKESDWKKVIGKIQYWLIVIE